MGFSCIFLLEITYINKRLFLLNNVNNFCLGYIWIHI